MSEVNKCGIIVEGCEKISFGRPREHLKDAEVKVSCHNGKWFMATSYNLPLQGSGYGVSINESEHNKAYDSKDEAIEAGKEELKERLGRVLSREYTQNKDREVAERILKDIAASNQMALF